MTRKTIFAYLLATFLATRLGAAVTVTSNFDPANVAPGEHSSYVITVNGSSTGSLDGTPPEVDGLTVGSNASTSSRVSIVNGSVSTSVQYSYPCYATREGTYTVPAFEAKLDGDPVTVPATTLTVAKEISATETGGSDAMLVEITAPDSLYVGQSAEATVRFMVRNDLTNIHQFINPPKPVGNDGIFQEPFDNKLVSNERVQRGTTAYNTVIARTVITAITPGKQKYGYEASTEVAAQNKKLGRISAFNDPVEEMMRNMQMHQDLLAEANDRIITVSGHGEKEIEVKPLPPNAPDAFDGAIGTYLLTSNLASHKTKVGEPVELSVTITTPDGLKKLSAPAIDKSDDWRTYPPTEDAKADDALGLKGKKTYKFLLSPLRSGNLKTPALHFASLDPSRGEYRVIDIAPEEVSVEEMPDMPQPVAPVQKQKKEAATNPFAANMHPISLLDTPEAPNALLPPQRQKIFMWVQLIPALLLAWAIIVPIRRRRASRDPMAAVRHKNLKASTSARSKAAQAARRNDMTGFFPHAGKCLRHAVCARDPSRNPDTVSAADIVRLLGDEDPELRRDANLLFNGQEALKYGGVELTPAQLHEKLLSITSKLGVK